MNTTTHTISATLLAVLLAACGGGGGGVPALPPVPPPPPPTSALPEGDLIVFGPMPAGGNFTVANVSFSTSRALVTFNDQPSTLSAIEPGHIIAMTGVTDASERVSANELIFQANLIGNVDSVDAASGMLVVMGQSIEVDDGSILSTPLANFTRGEVVQVSGYMNDSGVTVASRIDYSVSNRELRLIGPVSSLDSAGFRFEINDLEVDYSQAQTIDTPTGEVTADMEVLITGSRSPNGTFQAQSVTHYDRDVSELAGSHFRAEGRITAARSGEDFSINGFPIVVGGQRDYRQGSSDDIAVGAPVRLEGNILNDGTAQAHRVWFLHD